MPRFGAVSLLAGLLAGAALGPPPAKAAWTPAAFPRPGVTLRAAATDGRVIAVSGSRGVFGVSEDGGRTWRLSAPTGGEGLDFRGLALTGRGGAVLLSAGDGSEGRARLFRTDDLGRQWRLAFETTRKGAFFDTVAFRGSRRGRVLGDPLDGRWFLLETRDGGARWTPAKPSLPPLGDGEAAFAASNSALALGPGRTLWIVSGGLARGRVFRSADGHRFQASETPLAGSATAGVFGALALDARRIVVVGGDYRDETRAGPDVATSGDGGQTWTVAASAGRLLEGVGRLDARTLIAVGPRGTLVSKDLGRTWTATDTEAFHAIACAKGTCVAAGPDGRVAVWK